MNLDDVKEPEADECVNRSKVYESKDSVGYACYYPQMGGYVGKCVVVFNKEDPGCFEALVWHDGDFPFSDGSMYDTGRRHIHHCEADQFIRFGNFVNSIQDAEKNESSSH